MTTNIVQLKKNGTIILPQTTAEAVVVNNGSNILTLDKVLKQKIESIESESLTVTKNGITVLLEHKNTIEPQTTAKPMLITYDKCGHITGSMPVGSVKVLVQGTEYLSYDGSEDSTINMGDDFTTNTDKQITLNWNEI